MSSNKKAELIKCASTMFTQNGYNATSLSDIAHYCNVTKPTITHHFGSKIKLLSECLIFVNLEFQSQVLSNIHLIRVTEELALKRFFQLVANFIVDNDYGKLIYKIGSELTHVEAVKDIVDKHINMWEEYLIKSFNQSGNISSARISTRVVISFIIGEILIRSEQELLSCLYSAHSYFLG